MNKKLLYLLFALCVLLLSFNIIAGLYLHSDKLEFNWLPWQKEETVKVISSVEGYKVSFNDKAAFEGYLEKVSFWQRGVLLYGESRRFVPDKLVIEFTDQPQERYSIVHPDNPETSVFSLGWKAEEKKGKYTLMVHLAKEIWQNYEEKDLLREIDTSVINGILYVIKQPGEYVLGYGRDKDIEISNEVSSRENRIFKVEKTAQGWKLNLVGKVYAVWDNAPQTGCSIQSCTGSVNCGTNLQQTCKCSVGDKICYNPGEYCYSGFNVGICTCTIFCGGASSWKSCGIWGNSCGVTCDVCEKSGSCDGSWYCPAACSCGSWVNGNCGAGGCPPTQRRQTRTCTPSGCATQSRCVDDPSCVAVPSCTVDLLPETASIQSGSSTTLTASVTESGTVDRVDFASANTGIVTVNPASDNTVVYSTQATGVAVGSTTVTANVIMGGSSRCNDLSSLTVTLPGPWWQVKDADVTTNGDLISPIPGSCSLPACNPVFGLRGTGGFPGVPVYGGSTADFLSGAGTGNAAESPYNWLANSRYNGRTYDYAFFERQIPDDVVINELTPPVTGGTFNSGGAPSRGYVWYHWNGATLGDLTINGNVNLVGSRRVVLMVEGANTIINGRIQLQSPGQGFFMMVVGKDGSGLKGDILVDPSVTNIEGIFLAESEFKTGVASSQFNARGSVVAYEGVSLERDLGASNANTPAEVFTYAPDIIATFPSVFTQRRIRWKEVAP